METFCQDKRCSGRDSIRAPSDDYKPQALPRNFRESSLYEAEVMQRTALSGRRVTWAWRVLTFRAKTMARRCRNCQAGHTGVVVLEMKIQLHENATTDTIFLKPDSIQIAAIS